MSNSINLVVLTGYLGAAPKIGESKGGVAYAHFSLATNFSWKDGRGDKHERTDWHRIVAFNGLAKSLARLGTGDQVTVEGRLKADVYEKDGVRHTSVEVVANKVQFMNLKGKGGDSATAAPAEMEPVGAPEDDDIPF